MAHQLTKLKQALNVTFMAIQYKMQILLLFKG
ncbi:hypothetical protein Nos7107_4010 [Nostoc sp. PCC 7107]|nr:hypothetical protein Nos7107_4010 [Nostoc sp. PCC 7107]